MQKVMAVLMLLFLLSLNVVACADEKSTSQHNPQKPTATLAPAKNVDDYKKEGWQYSDCNNIRVKIIDGIVNIANDSDRDLSIVIKLEGVALVSYKTPIESKQTIALSVTGFDHVDIVDNTCTVKVDEQKSTI